MASDADSLTPPGGYLLAVGAQSAAPVPLPRHGEISVGSSAGVDVRLADEGVAPLHARLVAAAGEVRIHHEQGQALLNGKEIDSGSLLSAGDVIEVGAARLIVHSEPISQRAPQLLPKDRLVSRLQEESERALRYERTLSVVLVKLGEAPVPRDAVELLLRGAFRSSDIVGWANARELVAILPETGEAARIPAQRLARNLAQRGLAPRVGFACLRQDGCSADTLLAGAKAAADAALDESVATVADAVQELRIGARRVLVLDPKLRQLYELIAKLATGGLPVLIMGETGVGKEIAVSALHAWSPRAAQPLVAINCAAVPASLLESELFGYERGAFTGASMSTPGLLETGSGGTVLLDEIGECPIDAQAKLLRVLETKRMARVGARKEREIDVRIVAATNRRLEAEIERGRFRQDLFFRLNAATIFIPPLRDRPLEIPVLARLFMTEACQTMGRSCPAFSNAALRRLQTYRWPGNVRELRNAMEYVATAAAGSVVEAQDLPDSLGVAPRGEPARSVEHEPKPGAASGEPELQLARGEKRRFRPLYEEIRELERTRMVEALEAASGVKARAAELIGMPLRTFATKLKEHGLS